MRRLAVNTVLSVVGISILTGLAAAWCAERLYERAQKLVT